MKSKTAKVTMALVLCPLVMLGLSFMLPKRYTATMSLMLDPSPRVISPNDPNAVITEVTGSSRGRSIETEIDKLQGTEVLFGAIQLTAQQHSETFARDDTKLASSYQSLINRLRIDNNRNSDVVDLRVTMDDPQIAADTANNIGQAYMDYNVRLSATGGNAGLMKLKKAVEEKKAELDGIDAKIAAIKTKYQMSDIGSAGGMQDKMIKDMETLIASTQAQYDGAVGELAVAQQQLSGQEKYIKTNVSTSLNPAAVDLDQKITQTSSDLEALRAKYTDDYPQVRQFQQKLNDYRAERAKIQTNIVSQTGVQLNPNYTSFVGAVATAQGKVNSLSGSLGALQSKLSAMKIEGSKYPEAEKQLSTLMLQKLSVQNQYQLLMVQKAPLELNGGSGREAPAQIVSRAYAPDTPSFPNPKVFVLMGLAVGIIISALIVMPKAPDIMYAPTGADALALDGTSLRTASALPSVPQPEPVRPAIEPSQPS